MLQRPLMSMLCAALQIEPCEHSKFLNRIFIYYFQYLAERRQATTEAIELILQNYFPNDYQERKEQYEQNMAELAR